MHHNSVYSLELVAIIISIWISHDPSELPITEISRTFYIYNFLSISIIVSKGTHTFIRIEIPHFTAAMKIFAIGGYSILNTTQLTSGATFNHIK